MRAFEFVLPCRGRPVSISIRADCLVVGCALAERSQRAVAPLIHLEDPDSLPILLIAPLARSGPTRAA